MTPHKRVIDGTTSKGKVEATTGGKASKLINNRSFGEGTTSISSREPTATSQPSQRQENLLFQKLLEMKEQIKKQQLQSDREWAQMTLNRDNIFREQEELKQLNQ